MRAAQDAQVIPSRSRRTSAVCVPGIAPNYTAQGYTDLVRLGRREGAACLLLLVAGHLLVDQGSAPPIAASQAAAKSAPTKNAAW